jgi:UDP-N-acetylglucosamine 2-epimerase (non-hydrolysing)
VPTTDLVHLVAAAAVLVSDDADLVVDAPGLGTPAVRVDGPHVPQPGDSIRSVDGSEVLDTVRQILDVDPRPHPHAPDGLEAVRVEAAVSWMFGLSGFPRVSRRPTQA